MIVQQLDTRDAQNKRHGDRGKGKGAATQER